MWIVIAAAAATAIAGLDGQQKKKTGLIDAENISRLFSTGGFLEIFM